MWSDENRINSEQAIYDKYTNVDMKLYQSFYDKVYDTLRAEEPYYCQDMYSSLDLAIQECLINQNANPQTELDKAASDFQAFLNQVECIPPGEGSRHEKTAGSGAEKQKSRGLFPDL